VIVLLLLLFPELFKRILDVPAISIPHLQNIFTSGAPILILAGVAVMVWLPTRDSIFAKL
jgi:hypothetical protein